MAIKIRGKKDPSIRQFVAALERYQAQHENAEIEVFRRNSAAIRVCVVDPDFEGKSDHERDRMVWPLLQQLPRDVIWELSILLLLTPDETKKSFAYFDFKHPLPSRL